MIKVNTKSNLFQRQQKTQVHQKHEQRACSHLLSSNGKVYQTRPHSSSVPELCQERLFQCYSLSFYPENVNVVNKSC